MKLTITKLTKKIMAVLTAVILAALAFLAVTAAVQLLVGTPVFAETSVTATVQTADEDEAYVEEAAEVAAADAADVLAVAAEEGSAPSLTAVGAAVAIGLAALGGAIAMGMAIAKAMEGIARQPEADGKIRSVLMLGLVFIETVVIYALIVAILIMFVV